MNGDLGQLLKDAVPEPTGDLFPDEIMRAARRGGSTRRWAGPVVAMAVFVGALGVASPALWTRWQSDPSAEAIANVPLTLSALEHRVPLLQQERPINIDDGTEVVLAHPGEGSLVATLGDDKIFLMETADERLCIVSYNELTGGGANNGCVPTIDLLTTGVTSQYGGGLIQDSAQRMHPTFWRFIVAAPDGYTLASAEDRTALITSNVAVLDLDTSGTVLTISGPAVPSVTFHLGIPGALDDATPSSLDAVARASLDDLARHAQAYLSQHGTTAGFANSVRADVGPEMIALIPSLTDTTATADLGSGQCLTADLLSGGIEQTGC